jgi:hypothetical protein
MTASWDISLDLAHLAHLVLFSDSVLFCVLEMCNSSIYLQMHQWASQQTKSKSRLVRYSKMAPQEIWEGDSHYACSAMPNVNDL